MSFFYKMNQEFTFDVELYNISDIKNKLIEFYGIDDKLKFKILSEDVFLDDDSSPTLTVVISSEEYSLRDDNIDEFNTVKNINSLSYKISNKLGNINLDLVIDGYLEKTYSWESVHSSAGVATILLDDDKIAVLSHPKYNFKVVPAYLNGPAKIVKVLKIEESMDTHKHTEAQNQIKQANNAVMFSTTCHGATVSINAPGSVSISADNKVEVHEQKNNIKSIVHDISDILDSEHGTDGFLKRVSRFKENKAEVFNKLEKMFNDLVGTYNEYYKDSLNMIEYDADVFTLSFIKTGRVIYVNPSNVVNVFCDPQYYLVDNEFFIHHSKVTDEFRSKYVIDESGFNLHEPTVIDFPFKTLSINGALMIIEKLDM